MKKKQKKWIMVALALAACLAVAGCGGQENDAFSEEGENDSPDETISQELFIEGFENASIQYGMFNSPAEENGLGGTPICIEGEVEEKVTTKNVLGFKLNQGEGKYWLVSVTDRPKKDKKIVDDITQKYVRVFGEYGGYSERYKMPVLHLETEGGKITVKNEGQGYQKTWDFDSYWGQRENESEDMSDSTKIPTDIPAEEPTPVPLAVEETELVNSNGVAIKTTGLTEEILSKKLWFEVYNSSQKDYSISAHTYAVNGLMEGGNTYSSDVDVPAGGKAKFFIELKEEDRTISDIDVIFWAYYDDIKEWDSGIIKIPTNCYNESLRYVSEGEEIYSDDNVSLYRLGDSGGDFRFSIYNKTGYNASFSIENCLVNEWSYELTNYTFDLFQVPVHSGSYCEFSIPIDDEFLSEYSISEVNSIQFNIQLTDDYWETGDMWEASTDKITVPKF